MNVTFYRFIEIVKERSFHAIRLAIFSIFLFFFAPSYAQKSSHKNADFQSFNYPKLEKAIIPNGQQSTNTFQPITLPKINSVFPQRYFHRARFGENGFPQEMSLHLPVPHSGIEKGGLQVVNQIHKEFGHANSTQDAFSWRIEKSVTDALSATHLYLQEYYHQVPIYNNTAVLHAKNGHFYHWNAQWDRVARPLKVQPQWTEQDALSSIKRYYFKEEGVLMAESPWIPEEANKGELYIYVHQSKAHLAWKFSYMPGPLHRWEVFVDAHTGKIIDQYENICTAHKHHDLCSGHGFAAAPTPPSITSGRDLNGINRSLNTYLINGIHYMIDATRSMFNNQTSNLPGDPKGAIWTVDARGGFPGGGNWAPQQIGNSSTFWNNPNAVSAHYNAGRAYEYFEQVFGRNSINGRGGNVISFVDVKDQNGAEMDNAFWNGVAIFYGNGNVAFRKPLASALDVAGHEMSHGVIQNTTNLEYRNESGALNESFADVFGVMIDRDDWLLGEDVVNNAVFRGGALRSMSDPHNGGRSLNDPGYQPRHYDERFTGSDDNGGVHINSGIPNFAFYKIATSLGKEQAEQIFYRALTVGYLTRSSQFIDFRAAIAQAAQDLFGASAAQTCHRACDEVGIPGSPGQEGNDYQNDLPLNPGREFLLASDSDLFDLYLLSGDGNTYRIAQQDLGSKPSVTDNGREVVYVGADNRMHYVLIDYSGSQPSYVERVLESTPQWSFAAFSKDGTKLAAVRNMDENILFVYDFISESWEQFELFNPSYTEGIETGEVRYADVLEWDYSGEYIMYDAFNNLFSNDGKDLSFWDIGFIKVWDRQRNEFADGRDIQKLFTALDPGVSIGNPSFSKNSPYIIAFDYIEGSDNYLVAANLESREANFLLTSDRLFYPNYNKQDNLLAFDAPGRSRAYDINALPMAEDKISASDNFTGLVESARWAVFISAGERDLLSQSENVINAFSLYPNPAENVIYLETDQYERADVEIRDVLGRSLRNFDYRGGKQAFSLSGLGQGWYLLRVRTDQGEQFFSLIKN